MSLVSDGETSVTIAYDDAVRSIYDAASDPERWPAALQAIADCMDDVGTVLLWRRDDGSIGTIVSPGLETSHAEYVAHWVTRDTRAHRAIERGYHVSIDAVTDRDVVDDDEVLTLPIYTDYLIPNGLGWFAATSVAPDPHVMVAISVQRRFDKPRFEDDELRRVSQLGRHVEQSLRLSIRLFEGEMRSAGLAQVLSSLNVGIFGLDSLGRVVMSNPAGDAVLGQGLVIRNERLAQQMYSEGPTLDALVAQVLRGSEFPEPRPVLLDGGTAGGRLVAHVLPLTASTMPAGAMLARARALVIVVSLDRNEAIDPTVLRDLLGLTLNEARVASLVGTGLQPRAVAEHLGIAEETARTVLKRVFAKVGLSRQAELVALLARLTFRA